jgi:hypothetical protein
MANTWIAESLETGARVDEFRSVDFDAAELLTDHGPVVVRDLTDGLRIVGLVVEDPERAGGYRWEVYE